MRTSTPRDCGETSEQEGKLGELLSGAETIARVAADAAAKNESVEDRGYALRTIALGDQRAIVVSDLDEHEFGAFAALLVSARAARARRTEAVVLAVAFAALAWAFTVTYGRLS